MGEGGSQKSRQKEQNQLICDSGKREEGGSNISADVIYGSPQMRKKSRGKKGERTHAGIILPPGMTTNRVLQIQCASTILIVFPTVRMPSICFRYLTAAKNSALILGGERRSFLFAYKLRTSIERIQCQHLSRGRRV